MQRGALIGQLRARFGERLEVKYGIATVDTNGDSVEVFYKEDEEVFKLDGTIVELGAGQHVSYAFPTLDQAMAAIDRLIAIEGPMPSVTEADRIVAAPVLASAISA
jgi:hypothetical protein